VNQFTNKKNTLNNILISVMLLGQILSVIGRTQGNHICVTISIWCVLIPCLIFGLKSLSMHYENQKGEVFLAFCGLMLFVFIAIINSGDFSYETILSCLMFIEIPLLLISIYQIENNMFFKKIYICHLFIAIYYIYFSFNEKAYYYVRNGYPIYDDLTLGLSNPNTAGIYLLVNLIVICSALLYFKKVWVRLVFLVTATYIMYLLFETHSRTGMLAAIIFIVLIIGEKLKILKITRKTNKLFFYVPLIYFFITVIFNEKMAEFELFGETVSTGRYEIYMRYWEEMDLGKILFGNLANCKFENLHNMYLSVFISVGLIAALLFAFLLYKSMVIICKSKKKSYQNSAVIGILMIILHSSAEADFFVEGTYFSAALFLLCCIANSFSETD